jgi:DNA-binding GntR family transcriptional regulator
VLRFDVAPGTVLDVADLSRRFRVPPTMLQEFLASLQRFGLVERRPRGGWRPRITTWPATSPRDHAGDRAGLTGGLKS